MKNRKYAVPLAAALLVGLVVVGVTIMSRVQAGSESSRASELPRAAVGLVHRGTIGNSLSVAGEFVPYQQVELHAKVAGYISKINVDIGDHVRAGQILAVLEVPELNAQVQGADAAVRHSQDEISRAQNEVSRAEADHAALHSAADRLKQAALARPGLIAQQELDNAEARDRASEAQVQAARSAYSASKQQLDVSRANHSQVSAMSGYSRIVAPFDGVVTWRYADTGALVQAGTTSSSAQPVLKLEQVNMLRLRVAIPESLAGQVHIGQSAQITTQATGATFSGKVQRLADALDRSTRTEQVEIDVPNKDQRLTPGMYADVVIPIQQHADSLLAPVEAVTKSDDKTFVLTVGDDGRVTRREVKIGMEDANSTEILAGLLDGDKVIVANLNSFREGQLVLPKLTSAISQEGKH